MRQLNANEIWAIAEEHTRLGEWQQYVDFAKKYYGETAYRIIVEFGSEYNDEGGFYLTIDHLSVEDKDGKTIELSDDVYDEVQDLKYELPHEESTPNVFVVDEPPKLTYDKVYVEA